MNNSQRRDIRSVPIPGNPCKVIRPITEEDRRLYWKKQEIDDEAWENINANI